MLKFFGNLQKSERKFSKRPKFYLKEFSLTNFRNLLLPNSQTTPLKLHRNSTKSIMLLTITINSSKKFDSNSRTVKLSNLENSQDATRQSFLLQNKTTKTRKRSKDILESPSSKLSIKEYILLTIRNNASKFPKHFQNCRTSWTT